MDRSLTPVNQDSEQPEMETTTMSSPQLNETTAALVDSPAAVLQQFDQLVNKSNSVIVN